MRDVQSGKTTTVQALNVIKAKGEEMHLSINQQASLGKELFGKAAANAGAYGEQMRLVAEAHKDQFADLTDLQKAVRNLLDENVKLQEAQDNALKSDAILAFKYEWERLVVRLKTLWYDFITHLRQHINLGIALSNALIEAFKRIPATIGKIFSGINKDVEALAKAFFYLGKTIKSAFTLDFEGVEESFKQFNTHLSNGLKNTKKAISEVRQEFKGIFANELRSLVKTQQAKAKAYELSNKKQPQTTDNGQPTANNEKPTAKSESPTANNELQKELELQKQKTEQSIELAKLELAEYIRLNAEKYKDDKRWTAERLKNQIDYYNEVKRQQLAILKQEQDAKEETIQIRLKELQEKKSLSANELQEKENLTTQLVIIEKQYAEERVKIEADTREKIKDDEETFDTQQQDDKKTKQAIEFQQRLIDLEIQGNQEFEIKKIQAQQQYEEDLADLEEKRQEGLISLENYEAQKKLIRDQYNQMIKDLNEQMAEAEMMNYEAVFSKAKDIFGEQTALGKAFAVAQATINTYLGATKALGTYGYPFGGIMAALTVASGMKSVHKIMSVQPPKAQRGMFIKGNSHAQGGVPILTPNGMIEAEGGEIIINKVSSYLFKDLLSEINVVGGGVKFAKGGVVGSQIPSVQRALKPLSQNITINDEAVSKIADAIYKGSQSGISDLSDNNRIMRGANF